MSRSDFTRRQFLQFGALSGGALLLTACAPASSDTPSSQAPGTDGPGGTPTPAPTGPRDALVPGTLEGGTVITDPARFPSSFNEAPELAELVASGDLPPVAERIGQDPLVIEPVHEIGTYGGILRRGFNGPNDRQNANRFSGGPDNLLYYDYTWETIIPNIARGYELSADGKVLTLTLRRGMKWSDGEPFTADDILFWHDDVYDPDDGELVAGASANLTVNGMPVQVEKVDQFTVRYTSPETNALLPHYLAGWTDLGGQQTFGQFGLGGYAPRHYLSQFHPRYVGQDEADRLAVEAGFDSWVAYIKNRNTWQLNTELPQVGPWVTTQAINNPVWILSRNPYSIWVDTEGNQLPYIGEIQYGLAEDAQVITLRAVAGEYDFQDRHLAVDQLPVLIENQERSNYVVHIHPSQQTDLGIRLNLSYDEDPEIGDLIRNVDFRRALSMGVDRGQINEVFFLGTSTPSATCPTPENKYYPGDEYFTKYAELDIDAANALLDGIGLAEKDADGFRLRRDNGQRLTLDYKAGRSFADRVAIGEMIKEHWQEIGIDLRVEEIADSESPALAAANGFQISSHSTGSDDPWLANETLFPVGTTNYPHMIGVAYARWFATDGAEGTEPFQEIKDIRAIWEEGVTSSPERQIELGKEIFKLHVDQVFTIGLLSGGLIVYGIYINNADLGNVPDRVVNTLAIRTPSNALPMTFYYRT